MALVHVLYLSFAIVVPVIFKFQSGVNELEKHFTTSIMCFHVRPCKYNLLTCHALILKSVSFMKFKEIWTELKKVVKGNSRQGEFCKIIICHCCCCANRISTINLYAIKSVRWTLISHHSLICVEAVVGDRKQYHITSHYCRSVPEMSLLFTTDENTLS